MIHRFQFISVLMFALIPMIAISGVPERPERSGVDARPEVVPNMLFVKMKQQPTMPSNAVMGVAAVDLVLTRIMASSVTPLHSNPSLRKNALPEAESLSRIFIVRYDAPTDPYSIAKELSSDPAVEYAEPCYVLRPLYTPNDPRVASQWALSAMNMFDAWDVTQGDSTIVIGYVDSGINYTHEDLAGAIWINPGEWGVNGELANNGIDDDNNGYVDDWRGWDFIGNGTAQNPNPNNDPMDFNGHGTNGAALAAATTDNGIGIAGVGFHTKLLPIKVQDDAGQGTMMGYLGIPYAADMGCKVINCSWGSNTFISRTMQDVIDYAWAKGALVVGGAGNNVIDNDVRPFLPSNLRHVLCVSSMEPDGTASLSTGYGSSVHVFAPGKDLLTARFSFGYQNVTGTSFSAPLMSGLAALIYSIHPDWTPDQVLKQIRVTSQSFGATRNPDYYGKPDAYRALTLNNTLSDIPGLMITASTATTPVGEYFSVGGQVAQVSVDITNMLAPTTENAVLSVAVKDDAGTVTGGTQPIGALGTMDKKTVNFTVRLNDEPSISEGYLAVVLTFTDGEYVDYDVLRIPLYIENAWHTSVDLRYPYTSIDMPDRWTIWVSGSYAPDGVTQQDIAIRSTDGGNTWTFAFGSGFPSPRGVYCIEGIDGNTALVGTGPADGNAAIFRTVDGGANWTGTSVAGMTGFVNWIHMFDQNNGIFQGDPKDGIWALGRTSDGGRSWAPISTPVAAPASEHGWNNSYDFIGDIGWFGTNNSRVYKTTDRGQTWTWYAMPSKNSIDVSFRDTRTGVARFSRQADQGTDTLAVTRDGGETWQLISSVAAPSGTAFFERGGKRLWFLRGANALVSTDVGATWRLHPAPADFNYISDADMWTDGFLTIAFAAGIEVYRFEAPFDAVSSANPPRVPIALSIDQLYPNPVQGQDMVYARFTTPTAQPITLSLYDLSGRLVHTVVSATLEAGNHTAAVSTAQLASGTYILRLASTTATMESRLVVTR